MSTHKNKESLPNLWHSSEVSSSESRRSRLTSRSVALLAFDAQFKVLILTTPRIRVVLCTSRLPLYFIHALGSDVSVVFHRF
jgi:hypothetical protein